MFDQDEPEKSIFEPPLKRNKLNSSSDSQLIHSSLKYERLRAPPLVDYKSIDDYCETKLGKSLQPSFGELTNSPGTSGLNNLLSISSPVVFKTPKPVREKILPHKNPKHYSFFSVEELAQVRSLKHWSKTEVCAVGNVIHKEALQECYFHGAMEKGGWEVLLDISLLEKIPSPQKTQQIFGTLELNHGIPCVRVYFHRELDSVNLPLLIESYKLMQRCLPELVIPEIEKSHFNNYKIQNTEESCKSNDTEESCESNETLGGSDECEILNTEGNCGLNDTLDNYDFSVIM